MPVPGALDTLAVIGNGIIGHGVAQIFAISGKRVRLIGREAESLKRAKERLEVKGAAAAPWYYGNVGEGGFYRVLHDPACLGELAPQLATALTPVERMGLLGHQWAIVRSGRARIASFLDLVDCADRGRLSVRLDGDFRLLIPGDEGFLRRRRDIIPDRRRNQVAERHARIQRRRRKREVAA